MSKKPQKHDDLAVNELPHKHRVAFCEVFIVAERQ